MMYIFGVRSPLVVEYEETCRRLDIHLQAKVSVSGTPRCLEATQVVDWEDLRKSRLEGKYIACAFSSLRRRELAALAESVGLRPCNPLIDPTAILGGSVRVGSGSYINAGTVIGSACLIGANVLINRTASIGHHAVISNHVSIGPGVVMAGNIHIGEGAIVGAGACVMPDIRIGRNAIVAGGALVRRHVKEGSFVDGHPAVERPFKLARSSLHVAGGE